jgi:hypothetical protein
MKRKIQRLNKLLSTLTCEEKNRVKVITEKADAEIAEIISNRDQEIVNLMKSFSSEKEKIESQISEYSVKVKEAEELNAQAKLTKAAMSNASVIESSKLIQTIVENESELVFICDISNLVYSLDGSYLRKWGNYGSDDGEFNEPFGIAVDPAGLVYVCDRCNHRIQVFRKDGTFVRKWGKLGFADGEFKYPSAIAVGENGNVYVADQSTCRIQVFLCDGTFLSAFGNSEEHDYRYSSIAIRSDGMIYANDHSNSRIHLYYPDGRFCKSFGDEFDGRFGNSYGLAISESGEVYVSQPNNNQIQVISSDEKSISYFIGRSPDDHYEGDDEEEEENITQFPCHIVILDDLLYISDDSQIHVFQKDGKFVKSSWENPFPVSYITIEAFAISIYCSCISSLSIPCKIFYPIKRGISLQREDMLLILPVLLFIALIITAYLSSSSSSSSSSTSSSSSRGRLDRQLVFTVSVIHVSLVCGLLGGFPQYYYLWHTTPTRYTMDRIQTTQSTLLYVRLLLRGKPILTRLHHTTPRSHGHVQGPLYAGQWTTRLLNYRIQMQHCLSRSTAHDFSVYALFANGTHILPQMVSVQTIRCASQ